MFIKLVLLSVLFYSCIYGIYVFFNLRLRIFIIDFVRVDWKFLCESEGEVFKVILRKINVGGMFFVFKFVFFKF